MTTYTKAFFTMFAAFFMTTCSPIGAGGVVSDGTIAIPDGGSVIPDQGLAMVDGGGHFDLARSTQDLANQNIPPGAQLWSRRMGGPELDEEFALAVDGAGNVIVTGTFKLTADFGGEMLKSAGSVDIFVVKYDPHGSLLWARRYGGKGGETPLDIAVTASGNVVIAGILDTGSDFGTGPLSEGAFVARISSDGVLTWVKSYPPFLFSGVACDANDNILVSGILNKDINFGGSILKHAGKFDIVFAKLTPEGEHIWSKSYGSAGDESGGQIAVDAAGDIVLTGGISDGTDLGGGTLRVATGDAFLAKYSPAGIHRWSKSIPNQNGLAYFTRLAIDRFNNIAVSSTPHSLDGEVYLSLHAPNGTDRWVQKSSAAVYGMDTAFDTSGRPITVITCSGKEEIGGVPLGCTDTLSGAIVKFSTGGSYLWHKLIPNQSPWTRVVTDGEHIIVAGSFEGTVNLGGGPLTSAGGVDIFLLKLSP